MTSLYRVFLCLVFIPGLSWASPSGFIKRELKYRQGAKASHVELDRTEVSDVSGYWIYVGPFQTVSEAKQVYRKYKRKIYFHTYLKRKNQYYLNLGFYNSLKDYPYQQALKSLVKSKGLRMLRQKKHYKRRWKYTIKEQLSEEVFVFVDEGSETQKVDMSDFETEQSSFLKLRLDSQSLYFSEHEDALFRQNQQLRIQKEGLIGGGGYGLGAYAAIYDSADDAFVLDRTYFRTQAKQTKVSLGYQNLGWGSVYEGSLLDFFSRQDFTQAFLYPYDRRILSQPTILVESPVGDQWHLQVAYLPFVERSLVPDFQSPWSLVNVSEGRIFGFGEDSGVSSLLQNAEYKKSEPEDPGIAFRMTKSFGALDLGLNYFQGPSSVPSLRFQVLDASSFRVEEAYPSQSLLVLSGSYDSDYGVIRFEVGHYLDFNVYDLSGEEQSLDRNDANVVWEFFPGDGDLQVVIQAGAVLIEEVEDITLSLRRYQVAGQIFTPVIQNVLDFTFRFQSELGNKGLMVQPSLEYTAIENLNVSLAYTVYDGEDSSFVGYYKDNDLYALNLAWVF